MKHLTESLVCLLVCFSILISFSSCNTKVPEDTGTITTYPPGYTGGLNYDPHALLNSEIHWVETFEEAMLAIEHLEAAGNIINKTIISSYENDVVDAKYCFNLYGVNAKKLEEGQEWYDRGWLTSISIFYVGFIENVSIEEIEYSIYRSYQHFEVKMDERTQPKFNSTENFSYACIECNNVEDEHWTFWMERSEVCLVIKENTNIIKARIYYEFDNPNHTDELPENFHEDFAKSLVWVETEVDL